MAFRPFGKETGPSMYPRPSAVRPSFGHSPRTPSPIHSPANGPQTRPGPSAFDNSGPQTQPVPSRPLAPQNSSPSMRPYSPGGVQRSPEPGYRTPSIPSAFQHSRPSVRPYQFSGIQRPDSPNRFPSPALAFQNSHAAVRPYQSAGIQKSIQTSNNWGDGPRSFLKENGVQSQPGPAARTSYVVSRSSGNNAAEISPSRHTKRTQPPPSFPAHNDIARNSQVPLLQRNKPDFPVNQSSTFPPKNRSPLSQTQNRPSPSFVKDNLARLPGNYTKRLTHQDQSPDSLYLKSIESLPIATSPVLLEDNAESAQNNPRRASISPPALRTWSNASIGDSDSPVPERPLSFANNPLDPTSRTTSSPAPKRTRSPLPSAEEVLLGNSGSSQDGTEREDQAKAKRLARFKGELGSLPIHPVDTENTKSFVNKSQKPYQNKQKFNPVEPNTDTTKADALSDYGSLESPSVIIGICPDMCPVSEREERERKGDLDQYERVDGDRNHTSKYLAVKKYTRTAEREAILIRPMPILQKTMDYLLNLLDHPYDNSFLGIYNFLWDRMRAVRMDLRMQHIFNQEAITMLEQMIRLHIIAMHELCEYTKGEGFSEGFDAHLNIEQMNKTSVELFQLYDDHRKRGIDIPTEKEFRGYYALLKLDKHPGYKVEPAELSLDLAKMTPEIRQTPEVLSARNVARACRTGNFIAFFRLARKASYLQACLMHAHFAKLRTQALASLHSGLLNNQGVPVSDVSKWIGMEEEDIDTLLEYHGFSIKEFEEPYMVKDGPFLNADKDYPTKCSELVHLKKSGRIAEDVSPPSPVLPLPPLASKETRPSTNYMHDEVPASTFTKQTSFTKDTQPSTAHMLDVVRVPTLKKQTSFHAVDEEMPESETSSSPKYGKPVVQMFYKPMVDQQKRDDQGGTPSNFSSPRGSPGLSRAELRNAEKPNNFVFGVFSKDNKFPVAELTRPALQDSSPKTFPMQFKPISSMKESSPSGEDEMEDTVRDVVVTDNYEDEETLENDNEFGIVTSHYDKEVAEAKLKLIIRLWKRWSSRKRELREQRQLAATAALNSLSLGPPIRLSKDDQPKTFVEFDIDQAMMKRYQKHEQSWSRLNISDVTANILSRRNPDSKCICWKIALCSQVTSAKRVSAGSQVNHSATRQWLLSKLMPSRESEDYDDDLLLASSGLSIWKRWVSGHSGSDFTCCLSVIRDVEANDDLFETVSGASALLFLVSEGIPWNLQKDTLNKILISVPSGSRLPLLIITGSYNGDKSDPTSNIVDELGLHYIDNSRISSFSVFSLVDGGKRKNTDQFFSDEQLREGLQWLANNAPLQPVLHCLKPRELVLNHLNLLLGLLGKMPDHDVGPNLCISAFNEALERSVGNIVSAAEANPFKWPCAEIELLEDSENKHLMVKGHLPSIGWSAAERIEPLKSIMKNLKLPSFHDDLTWLTRSCGMGCEIENQRLRLESCLIDYLTEKSKLMGDTLATKEACVMLQQHTRLELHNSSYSITPNWLMVMRRIFHWRLMGLSSTAFSSAYILKSDFDPSTLGYHDRLEVEDGIHLSYSPSIPSLDEIIEVGCSPLKSPVRNQAKPHSFKPSPAPISDTGAEEAANASQSMEKRREFLQKVNMVVEDNIAYTTDELKKSKDKAGADSVSTGTDRLSELLEKCNIVQSNIEKKLSIYF